MEQNCESNTPAVHNNDRRDYSHESNGVSVENGQHDLDESYEDSRDDGSIKLFVGQVPRTLEVENLRPLMEDFGKVIDIAIIRDKNNGAHRGCAFVTFATREAGEAAILTLHNQVTLPHSTNPLQVRPAEGQPAATQEHKLFIGMLPKTADETIIKEIFSCYGEIEEVYILRHQSSGQSKGCAFLKYRDRESAVLAIEAVHGKLTMEGGNTTLVVKFADTRRQRLQKQRNQVINSAGYWSMSPPPSNLSYPQLQQMQHQYLQQMQAFGAAQAGGTNAPYLFYNPYAYGYGFPQTPPFPFPTSVPPEQASPPELIPAVPMEISKQNRTSCQLEGPAGANLFIYHLPHDLTDADLATAFAPFGTVISAKVYMDKNTGESKGFGFVSYDSVPAAEAAITSMNGFQIGSKRLKVQHKRVHNRDDLDSSNEGSQQGDIVYDSEDCTVNEENVECGANSMVQNHVNLDISLEQSVHNLRLSG